MNPPLRHFATELKIVRECAGMTQEQLAKACNYSKSVVAMVETLQRPPTKDFVDRVDKALATGGRFDRMRRDLLVPEVDPSWFRPWRDHEQEATEIRWYEPLLVPGLLQTAAYAKALLEDDDRVASRLERQEVLDRAGVYVVIEEGVLYRMLGDKDVMYEQLTALATTTRAVVRVLAHEADTRRRYDGSFALAMVDGAGVGYVDTPARGFVVTDPGVVSSLRQRWEEIVAEALPRNLSKAMISKVADEQWKIEAS